MKEKKYLIGVDLGGTFIRAAAVLSQGDILAREKRESGAKEGYRVVLGRILECVEAVTKEMGHTPEGLGLASAGAIDCNKGIITKSPHFPDWKDAPLGDDVAGELTFPVVLENDANSAAIGEKWIGAAKDWTDFVALTLGTGVGGGVVLKGELWRGPGGMGGEIGHILVEPGGRLCGCGAQGCLETYSSATGVTQTAREMIDKPEADWLKSAVGSDIEKIDAEIITNGAKNGDRLCLDILEDAGKYLGRAIAQAALLLDVSKFVIAGGMSPALPYLEPAMRKEALKTAYTLTDEKLIIRKAALGDDAGILGAVKMVMERA